MHSYYRVAGNQDGQDEGGEREALGGEEGRSCLSPFPTLQASHCNRPELRVQEKPQL